MSGSLETPQSLNRYSYVQNNPVDWVDPDGLLRSTYRLPCPSLYGTGFTSAEFGVDGLSGSPDDGIDIDPSFSGGSDPDWEMLWEALDIAWNKLQNCASSFNLPDGINLNDFFMESGTTSIRLAFGDLGAPDNMGRVTVANTVGILGTTTPPNGTPRSAWVGATVTINNNPMAPFKTGYKRTDGTPIHPGLTFAESLAVTLLHEFGHAIALLYGQSSSPILDDKGSGDDDADARRSYENTEWILDNCFK
jgi:hypothetical protein